jgi:hypothetical protein
MVNDPQNSKQQFPKTHNQKTKKNAQQNANQKRPIKNEPHSHTRALRLGKLPIFSNKQTPE